ncbi:hypothetical protein JZ751_029728 [Albula glossodonta]|uniref:Uncharacterized protein n=1 Tax=Albula glossodonta TaxID=121402 RepID=A0A8T2NL71_9TELE|nr:hypothetical protein JZ751_029728 [Albula glossodonta]
MDMLEQSLDTTTSHEKQEEEVVQISEGDNAGGAEQTAVTIAGVQPAATFADHNIQYQFRTENSGGQVTYRVVQVTDQQLEGGDDGGGAVSVVSTAAFAGAQQAVAQAVIQNPFSNGGSPGGDIDIRLRPTTNPPMLELGPWAGMEEPRVLQATPEAAGHCSPGARLCISDSLTALGLRSAWFLLKACLCFTDECGHSLRAALCALSQCCPSLVSASQGLQKAGIHVAVPARTAVCPSRVAYLVSFVHNSVPSVPAVLMLVACDYIRELRQNNQRLQESFKEVERVQVDNELLRQQIEELKNENALLRAQMQQHGIESVGETASQ